MCEYSLFKDILLYSWNRNIYRLKILLCVIHHLKYSYPLKSICLKLYKVLTKLTIWGWYGWGSGEFWLLHLQTIPIGNPRRDWPYSNYNCCHRRDCRSLVHNLDKSTFVFSFGLPTVRTGQPIIYFNANFNDPPSTIALALDIFGETFKVSIHIYALIPSKPMCQIRQTIYIMYVWRLKDSNYGATTAWHQYLVDLGGLWHLWVRLFIHGDRLWSIFNAMRQTVQLVSQRFKIWRDNNCLISTMYVDLEDTWRSLA